MIFVVPYIVNLNLYPNLNHLGSYPKGSELAVSIAAASA